MVICNRPLQEQAGSYGHPPAPAPSPVPAAGSRAAATASVRWVDPDPTAAAEDAAA